MTSVPDGQYTLQVTVNPDQVLNETNYANNSAMTTVTIDEPSGVSHRPDGQFIPGEPLRAQRDGPNVRVTYDVSFCPASNYNLYYGLQTLVSAYGYDGAFCNLGTDGEELLPLPDPAPGEFVWFIVVGREGGTEGGHGFDLNAVQRPLTGQGFCSINTSQPSFGCQP